MSGGARSSLPQSLVLGTLVLSAASVLHKGDRRLDDRLSVRPQLQLTYLPD